LAHLYQNEVCCISY